MAIYHLSGKVFSRAKGASAVAKAAYRAGEDLYDRTVGKAFTYAHRKDDVAYKAIITPKDVPDWVTQREELWNRVELGEKRKDAQLAREFTAALPVELSLDKNTELITRFVQENFVDKGMIADVAIHDAGSHNPHAHIMLTMRDINSEGFGKKNRDWNKKEQLASWRENWSILANEFLEESGSTARIDHRTLEAQGIDRKATIHLGVHTSHMERKDIATERGDWNRAAKAVNEKLRTLKALVLKLSGGMMSNATHYLQSLPSLVQLRRLNQPISPGQSISDIQHHGQHMRPPDPSLER
jgi:ATP-dependent exoDNAse (exonuclease V) alpha subunit